MVRKTSPFKLDVLGEQLAINIKAAIEKVLKVKVFIIYPMVLFEIIVSIIKYNIFADVCS